MTKFSNDRSHSFVNANAETAIVFIRQHALFSLLFVSRQKLCRQLNCIQCRSTISSIMKCEGRTFRDMSMVILGIMDMAKWILSRWRNRVHHSMMDVNARYFSLFSLLMRMIRDDSTSNGWIIGYSELEIYILMHLRYWQSKQSVLLRQVSWTSRPKRESIETLLEPFSNKHALTLRGIILGATLAHRWRIQPLATSSPLFAESIHRCNEWRPIRVRRRWWNRILVFWHLRRISRIISRSVHWPATIDPFSLPTPRVGRQNIKYSICKWEFTLLSAASILAALFSPKAWCQHKRLSSRFFFVFRPRACAGVG